jgi:hypothetical protein
MSSEDEDQIFRENISVGCECYNPNLFNLETLNDSDYVINKKIYIIKYLMNIVIHNSKDLIGIRKCYGKQQTNIVILQSSYRSHQNTIQKLREFLIKKKSLKPISLSFTKNKIPVENYISTIKSICETFEKLFSNIFSRNHLVDIALLIKSCKFHLQTLNIFEEILKSEKDKDGRSIEVIQYKPVENEQI